MIRAITLLAVASVVAVSAYAQPFVSAGEMHGDHVCGEMASSFTYQQQICISNPSAEQREFKAAFKIYTSAARPVLEVTVNPLNGIVEIFNLGWLRTKVDWVGDTAVIGIHAEMHDLFPGGLPASPDTIAYIGINFRAPVANNDPYTLYVDSAVSPTYGDWYWSAPGAQPSWGGQQAYYVRGPLPNCCVAAFTNEPSQGLQASPCNPAAYDFNATALEGDPLIFWLVAGPLGAAIDSQTGQFFWQPGVEDVGDVVEVYVAVAADICPDDTLTAYIGSSHLEFAVTVLGCSPPEFVRNQPNKFVISTGETPTVSMQVTDPDPVNYHTYSWYVTAQDVMPPCETNPTTGQFTYTGTAADTGLYYVYEVVHDGPYADTTGFYLYHFDSYICGNMDHSGGIIVSDLNWLVSYLFRGGPQPVTMDAGNVDCKAGIGVADLTYIVNFLFKGGTAPCALCP